MTPPTVAKHAAGTFTILHTNDIHGDMREFVVDTGDATSQTGDHGRTYQEYPEARHHRRIRAARDGSGRGATRRGRAGSVPARRRRRHVGDGLLANLLAAKRPCASSNALGYTFMTLRQSRLRVHRGSHARLQTLANFRCAPRMRSSRATGEPFLGDPTVVVTAGGVRVGLLARTITTPIRRGTRTTPGPRVQERNRSGAARVPELRADADVVVVVSHRDGDRQMLCCPCQDRYHRRRTFARSYSTAEKNRQLLDGPGTLRCVRARGARRDRDRRTSLTTWGNRPRVVLRTTTGEPRFAAMIDSMRAPYRERSGSHRDCGGALGRQYKSESPST